MPFQNWNIFQIRQLRHHPYSCLYRHHAKPNRIKWCARVDLENESSIEAPLIIYRNDYFIKTATVPRSEEEMLQLLEQLPESCYENIFFRGGKEFMKQRFLEFSKYFKNHKTTQNSSSKRKGRR